MNDFGQESNFLFIPFMLFACFILIILAIVLPSLRISPLLRIAAIALLYTVALSAIYIQSIGSGIGIFSGLFQVTFSQSLIGNFLHQLPLEELLLFSLMPVKPAHGLTKSQLCLSDELKQILVGLFLGDAFGENISKSSLSVRLKFEQGLVHEEYLLHLYSLFEPYCSSEPKIKSRLPHKVTGMIYSSIYFNTYSLPCFNSFYNLFYLEGNKIVPSNIFDLLTALGLAYWIADDGSFSLGFWVFRRPLPVGRGGRKRVQLDPKLGFP